MGMTSADFSLENISFLTLEKLACDQAGSRVVEAFMMSNVVDTKTKNKLIQCFQGKYVEVRLARVPLIASFL